VSPDGKRGRGQLNLIITRSTALATHIGHIAIEAAADTAINIPALLRHTFYQGASAMNRSFSFGGGLVAVIGLVATLSTAGCGRALADDPKAPVAVTVSQTYLTVNNKAGSPLIGGTIELVPSGVLAPYRTSLPRVESGSNREVRLDRFSGAGGARFLRGTTRIRSVRLLATDMTGKVYKREVPFD
jgi:hypothetical protein